MPSAASLVASGVASTSYAATGLTASTTYYFRVTAVNGGGESAATNQASATTAGTGTISCHVTYTVSGQNSTAFNGAFTIQNTGAATITAWKLTWTFAGNQEVSQSSGSTFSQSGANIKLTALSSNANIAAGATLGGVGFKAKYQGSNPAPTAFFVNGTLCQ